MSIILVAAAWLIFGTNSDAQRPNDVLVPGRLLNNMQAKLVEQATFLQAVDSEEIEGLDLAIFERNFLGAVTATCDVRLSQGQRIRISNAQATINVCSEVTGNLSIGSTDMESAFLLAVGDGGEQFFDSDIDEETVLELFWLNQSEPFQIFTVNTPQTGQPRNVVPAEVDGSLFANSMTISEIASVCTPKGDNNIVTSQAGDPIPGETLPDDETNLRPVVREENASLVTLLPYTDLPANTQVVDIFYSASDVVVEIGSLMLAFVDLWFLREIKPPNPIRASTLATVILVWVITVVVGSFNIYTIAQTHSRVFATWVGCGTWEMVKIDIIELPKDRDMDKRGFMGRYVCQMITIQRTVEWYAYLLYLVPIGVIATVTTVTVYALIVRGKYGLDKSRSIRRTSLRMQALGTQGPDEAAKDLNADSLTPDENGKNGVNESDDDAVVEQKEEDPGRRSKGLGSLFSSMLPF